MKTLGVSAGLQLQRSASCCNDVFVAQPPMVMGWFEDHLVVELDSVIVAYDQGFHSHSISLDFEYLTWTIIARKSSSWGDHSRAELDLCDVVLVVRLVFGLVVVDLDFVVVVVSHLSSHSHDTMDRLDSRA